MKRTTQLALVLGFAVTIIVVVIGRFGGLRLWEQQSIDFRFLYVPRPAQPMSGRIVHVDIDDGSLDRIGRWPWDRSKLADVVDELVAAGAKTIAIDLVLTSASEVQAIDHDARLAASLAKGNCVLPVVIHEGALRDPVWESERGRAELGRLLAVLGGDVQVEPEEALAQAGVAGAERRARFLRRPLVFKEAAAWEVLRAEAGRLESVEAFERLIAPNRSEHVGAYPEQPLVHGVWMQHEAWRHVRRHLLPDDEPGAYKDRAPLPGFAAASGGVGFVNVGGQKHGDGSVREIAVRLPAPGGAALQFGLAAAAEHMGLGPTEITVDDDRLRLGEVRLPLIGGRLWINWPTSDTDPRWEGLLRQEPGDQRNAGHVPIRELVELAQARRTHRSNRAKFADLTGRILEYAQVPYARAEPLLEKHLLQAADEVDFTLADAPEDGQDDLEREDPAYAAHVHDCRLWSTTRDVVNEGQQMIGSVSGRLARQMEGKLVFIGWTATGALADFVPTSIDSRTPGVVVHAAVANMALTGRAVRFLPAWEAPIVAVAMGLLCTIAAVRFSTFPSLLLAAGLLVAYVLVAGVWLFAVRQVLMPFVEPIVAGAASWTACMALQAAVSQRERLRITRQFKARVSAQLVDHLVDNPAAVTMTGEERELTVLFGDLAGFTSISERLGGPTTVSTLNRYMGALTEVLITEGAYLNKFLGDGLMAFWSAFAVDPEQASKACSGALNCQNAVEQLNDDPQYRHIPRLGLRIGIATGRVVVGDCGAPPALNDYTVIGDAVNLASRLESANKQFGTRILINGRTRELLDDAPVLVRFVGRIIVVGQSAPVQVYEVLAPETPEEFVRGSEAAISALSAGRVDEGLQALHEVDQRFGASKLSELYREAVSEAGETFDGVLRLREK